MKFNDSEARDRSMNKLCDSILRAHSRPIVFYRHLAEVAGSANGGIFLSQCLYWTERSQHDGWFYKTADEWTKETTLSRYEQSTVRKKLIKSGILKERLIGMPATLWFRVDLIVLDEMIRDEPHEMHGAKYDPLASSIKEPSKLDLKNLQNLDSRNLKTSIEEPSKLRAREIIDARARKTETTTENTEEARVYGYEEEANTAFSLAREGSSFSSPPKTKSIPPPASPDPKKSAKGVKKSPFIDQPPSDQEVAGYCKLREIPFIPAQKQILIWSDGDWKYSKGEPVLSWKQAILKWSENGWLPGQNSTNGRTEREIIPRLY